MKYYGVIGQSVGMVEQSPDPSPPDGYIEMVGERPTTEHIAQSDGTWALPSLDEVKAQTAASLRDTRDALEVAPIAYNGHTFDYDEKAIMRITAARGTMQRNGIPVIAWTTADNQVISLSVADFDAIDDLAAMRSIWLHGKYGAAKSAILAASSAAEVAELAARAFDKEATET
jgi:hypothetical protein